MNVNMKAEASYAFSEASYAISEASYANLSEASYALSEASYAFLEASYANSEASYAFSEASYAFSEASYAFSEASYAISEASYALSEASYAFCVFILNNADLAMIFGQILFVCFLTIVVPLFAGIFLTFGRFDKFLGEIVGCSFSWKFSFQLGTRKNRNIKITENVMLDFLVNTLIFVSTILLKLSKLLVNFYTILAIVFPLPFVICVLFFLYTLLFGMDFNFASGRRPISKGAARESDDSCSMSLGKSQTTFVDDVTHDGENVKYYTKFLNLFSSFFEKHGVSVAYVVSFVSAFISILVVGRKIWKRKTERPQAAVSKKWYMVFVGSVVSAIFILVAALGIKLSTSDVTTITEAVVEDPLPSFDDGTKYGDVVAFLNYDWKNRQQIKACMGQVTIVEPLADSVITTISRGTTGVILSASKQLSYFPEKFLDAWYSELPEWETFKRVSKPMRAMEFNAELATSDNWSSDDEIVKDKEERYLDSETDTPSTDEYGTSEQKRKHKISYKDRIRRYNKSGTRKCPGEKASYRVRDDFSGEEQDELEVIQTEKQKIDEEIREIENSFLNETADIPVVSPHVLDGQVCLPRFGEAKREDGNIFMNILTIFTRVVCVVFTVGLAWIAGRPISGMDIFSGINIARGITELNGDVQEILVKAQLRDDPQRKMLELTEDYEKHCTRISSTPAYKYAINKRLLAEDKTRLEQMSEFLRTNRIEGNLRFMHMKALGDFTSIVKNQLSTFSRQEPFLVLFTGKGGIGKTRFCQHLKKEIVDKVLINANFTDDTIDISTNNKYWPALAGQRLVFCDEVLQSRTLDEDLVMGNLRPICSSAHFNAEGAAVEAKNNPINFEIILATTNASLDDIVRMISEKHGRNAIQPYVRRMLIYDLEHVEDKGKDWNPDTAHSFRADFGHLRINRVGWNTKTSRLERNARVTVTNLFSAISERHAKMNTEFMVAMQKITARPEASVAHYCVNMHGPGGCGKTVMMGEISSRLATQYSLPVVNVGTDNIRRKIGTRSIVILDDYFGESSPREREEDYMNFYNRNLPSGSIILTASNIRDKYTFPIFHTDGLLFPRKHFFNAVGVSRRTGFTGTFEDGMLPAYNTEFFVKPNKLYLKRDFILTWNFCIAFISAFLFSGTIIFWNIPLALISLFAPYLYFKIAYFEKSMDANSAYEKIFESYKTFLNAHSTVPYVYDVKPVPMRYDLELVAAKSQDVKFSENIFAMYSHFFYDRARFEACNEKWKFFVNKEIHGILLENSDRFTINTTKMDHDTLLGIVQCYAHGLKSLGIDATFRACIDDLGEYIFQDGKLHICVAQSVDLKPIMMEDRLAFYLPLGGGNQRLEEIAYSDVDNWATNVVSRNYTSPQALMVGKMLQSSRVRTNGHFIAYIARKEDEERKRQSDARKAEIITNTHQFFTSPFGKLVTILVGIYSLYSIISLVGKFLESGKKKKNKKKKHVAHETNDTSDSDDGDEPQGPSGKKKKIPKTYDSDVDQQGPSGKKKSIPKTYDSDVDKQGPSGKKKKIPKTYDSDIETQGAVRERRKRKQKEYSGAFTESDREVCSENIIKMGRFGQLGNSGFQCESHRNLVDMNEFDPYQSVVGNSHNAAVKNQVMVYSSFSSDLKLAKEPVGSQMVYGTMVNDRTMITVSHITKTIIKGLSSVYVCADELPPGAHKMTLVRNIPERDISIWTFSDSKLKGPFKNISKHFISESLLNDCGVLSVFLQRWGPNKTQNWNGGDMTFLPAPYSWFGDGGIVKSGEVFFGTFGPKFTTYGDCGLPYFCADNYCCDKICGIHFGGNSVSYTTIGIMASVTREDVVGWISDAEKFLKETTPECKHCNLEKTSVCLDSKPKGKGHYNVWNKEHDATKQSFLEEYNVGLAHQPSFLGIILKNSGIMYGSVKHSHTQFVPDSKPDFVRLTNGWQTATLRDLDISSSHLSPDMEVIYCVKNVGTAEKSMRNALASIPGNDFRISLSRYQRDKNDQKILSQTIFIVCPAGPVREGNVSLMDINGQAVYVERDTKEFLHYYDALYNQKGKLPCIPFNGAEDNETCRVFGVLPSDVSKVKSENKIFPTPFSNDVLDLIPNDKIPFSSDIDKCPPEQLEKLKLNSFGKPDARVTQSLMWAHKNFFGDHHLRKYVSDQFYSKIMRFYSNLTLLTDTQVLEGLKPPHAYCDGLSGMELDTSVGPSMKMMFNCTKKNDIISVTEKGGYYWKRDTDAGEFAFNTYQEYKKIQDQGLPYYNAFCEMVKVEKLKKEKQFLGRIFCAQDLIGVMLERRSLGAFCARAMLHDNNCGIGKNDVSDFHRHYCYLAKHPNYFTGDYKRWDKTVPLALWQEIATLLIRANPVMGRQIASTIQVLSHRLHYSGTTLFSVDGGMASGCVVTAVMNSLINDYLTYYCFVSLARKNNFDPSFQSYEKNVSRIFTGDDVAISVSDSCKFMNRTTMSEIVGEHFGMTLDSSQKDGSKIEFETYEEGSWISRFFRRLDNRPIFIGALKKESIGAYFHWTTDNSPAHIVSLLMRAQWEASLWGREYFGKISQALAKISAKYPKISKHPDFFISSYEAMIDEIYMSCLAAGAMKNSLGNSDCLIFKELTVGDLPVMAYSMKINELFQHGKITKPTYTFTRNETELDWLCRVDTTRTRDGQPFSVTRWASAKGAAKENACTVLYTLLTGHGAPEAVRRMDTETPRFQGFVREMDVTAAAEGKIAGGQLTAIDAAQTPQSGIMSNTVVPSVLKDMNPTAIALNNAAATGAPFNRHASCYNIWHDNPAWDFNINGSLSKGAELCRISLDPKQYPKHILDYMKLHHSYIPEIDVAFRMAGAAGTIAFIRIGWVADITKESYTLSELQNVSSIDINLNTYQSSSFKVRDIRRSHMYRKFDAEGEEPFPGIVFMVLQPSTNVQRNDDVDYPCQFQMKLGDGCVLMEGFRDPGDEPPSGADIDLAQYFTNSQLVLVDNTVADDTDYRKDYPGGGFYADPSRPIEFSSAALSYVGYAERVAYSDQARSGEVPTDNQKIMLDRAKVTSAVPMTFHLTWGHSGEPIINYDSPAPTPVGTVYSINKQYYLTRSGLSYECGYIYVTPESMTAVFTMTESKYLKWQSTKGDPTTVVYQIKSAVIFSNEPVAVEYESDNVLSVGTFYTGINNNKFPDFKDGIQIKDPVQTYVRTGNNYPMSQIPTGMTNFSFGRVGTSASAGGPSVVPAMSGVGGLLERLQGQLDVIGTNALKMNFEIDGKVEGQLSFANRTLMVRSNEHYLTRLYSGNGKMVSLSGVQDPASIQSFNVNSWMPWVDGASRFVRRPRFPGAVREAGMAAIAGAGMLSGIGNAIQSGVQMNFSREMLQKQLQNNLDMIYANGKRQGELARLQQSLDLEKMGYGSSIAQMGQVQQHKHEMGMQSQRLNAKADLQAERLDSEHIKQNRDIVAKGTQGDLERGSREKIAQMSHNNALDVVASRGLEQRKALCLDFEHQLEARPNPSFKPAGIMAELYPPVNEHPTGNVVFDNSGSSAKAVPSLNPEAPAFRPAADFSKPFPGPKRDALIKPVNNY